MLVGTTVAAATGKLHPHISAGTFNIYMRAANPMVHNGCCQHGAGDADMHQQSNHRKFGNVFVPDT